MSTRLSVCGLASRDGAYLLVQRKPGGSQGLKWEFPGGKVEGAETAAQAVAREWEEELGLKIQVGELRHSTTFVNNNHHYELQAWSVTAEHGTLELRDHLQAVWVPKPNLLDYDLSDSDRRIAEFLAASD